MKHIKLSGITYKSLRELSEKRKGEEALIRTMQDIAAEAIAEMHNRELQGLKEKIEGGRHG